MFNPLEAKKEALGKVHGAMTALEMFPEVQSSNSLPSMNMSNNPIELLVDFLKTTQGYDMIVEKLSEYIQYALPALEVTTKTILLSHIQTMLTCSIIPLITYDDVKYGVVFDLNATDLLNIFRYSPISKKPGVGKYYYFGCDEMSRESEVVNSRDLNAVLWYAKNHPNERIVWRDEKSIETPTEPVGTHKKQPKSNGIVTFEYNIRDNGLKDYTGNAQVMQEPIQNTLHCFLGCAKPIETAAGQNAKDEIANCQDILAAINETLDYMDELSKEIDKWYRKKRTDGLKMGREDGYFQMLNDDKALDLKKISQMKSYLTTGQLPDNPVIDVQNYTIGDMTIQTVEEEGKVIVFDTFLNGSIMVDGVELPKCQTSVSKLKMIFEKEAADQNGLAQYLDPRENYYYHKPLMIFNKDFIMSCQLYDRKVVTAQLIDAITKCFSLNFELSIEEKVVKAQIRDMVKRIIDTDDAIVNDCFFAFTNDQYNSMLNESELLRMGIKPFDNDRMRDAADPTDILNNLNNLSADASKEEVHSIIKGSIMEAVSSTNPHSLDEYEYNPNLNIIENLLQTLTEIIVMVVLSPKIYIILMMNLIIMGNKPEFNLQKFIEMFKQLILSLIRSIRDQILQFFYDEIMKILAEILKALGIRLSLEQYRYYIALLKQCIECFKLHAKEYDWAQDEVNYADIEEATRQVNEEC